MGAVIDGVVAGFRVATKPCGRAVIAGKTHSRRHERLALLYQYHYITALRVSNTRCASGPRLTIGVGGAKARGAE